VRAGVTAGHLPEGLRAAISVALFLLYGNLAPASTLEPILGTASAGILLAMLLMLYMVIRFDTEKARA
jgi:hypothetical protein